MKNGKDKKNKKEKKDALFNWQWVGKIFIVTFSVSLALSFISESASQNLDIWAAVIILVIFILIGITFDIIGTAVTAADEKIFNSMCSKRVKGAATALRWVHNADTVANFCNDVIGDISGVLSGSVGIVISSGISSFYGWNLIAVTAIITAFISAVTVSGKACGKNFAIKKSNKILFFFARTVCFFGTEKKRKR